MRRKIRAPDASVGGVGVSGYRYGFNGQEKSDEINGEGNSYTAQFWEYDSRIGRRWNLDPKPDVRFSAYAVLGDNPIMHADPLGDTLSPMANAFRTYMATQYGSGVANRIIPDNKAGERVAGTAIGTGEAVMDAAKAVKNLFTTNPITTLKGVANSMTLIGQMNNMVNIAINYSESEKQNGVTFTNYRYASYGASTVAISIFGPKVVKGAGGYVFNEVAERITTSDGFLLGGITIKAPFSINVQRFGGMNLNRPDFWGLRIGKGEFVNRTFAAITPEWNPLNVHTSGVIPKGAQIKFGVIGPQPGGFYLGGSLQFVVDSKVVTNQTTTMLSR